VTVNISKWFLKIHQCAYMVSFPWSGYLLVVFAGLLRGFSGMTHNTTSGTNMGRRVGGPDYSLHTYVSTLL